MPRNNLALGVQSEENGTFEAMMPGQDPGKGRKGFLRLVLVIAGDEDEVLALSCATGTFVDKWPG